MHYIEKYLTKLLKLKEEKGWKYLYFMIDVHNTIIKSTYNKTTDFEYFPYALETLKLLKERGDIKIIMWTSSYPEVIEKYDDKFWEDGVCFNYVNENPEIENDDIRCFSAKFFYDFGIDDKFGFDAETDWKVIYDILSNDRRS